MKCSVKYIINVFEKWLYVIEKVDLMLKLTKFFT